MLSTRCANERSYNYIKHNYKFFYTNNNNGSPKLTVVLRTHCANEYFKHNYKTAPKIAPNVFYLKNKLFFKLSNCQSN